MRIEHSVSLSHIYIYIYKLEYLLISSALIQYHVTLYFFKFLPSHVCTLTLYQWETWFPLSIIHFLVFQLRSYLSHFTCQTACLISSNSCKCPFYLLSLPWFKPRCPTKYFHSNFSLSERKENLVWQTFIVELQYAKYCYTLCMCAVWYKYKLTQALDY